MARVRSITPGFFKHEGLAELPPLTRLFFVGLWTVADHRGRLEDRPKRLRAEILPYDENCSGEAMLRELDEGGFISRYQVDGQKLIWIPAFTRHQFPNVKEKARPSTFPAHPDDDSSTRQDKSRDCAGTVPEAKETHKTAKTAAEDAPAYVATPDKHSVGTVPEPCGDKAGTEPEPNRDGAGTAPAQPLSCLAVKPLSREAVKPYLTTGAAVPLPKGEPGTERQQQTAAPAAPVTKSAEQKTANGNGNKQPPAPAKPAAAAFSPGWLILADAIRTAVSAELDDDTIARRVIGWGISRNQKPTNRFGQILVGALVQGMQAKPRDLAAWVIAAVEKCIQTRGSQSLPPDECLRAADEILQDAAANSGAPENATQRAWIEDALAKFQTERV